ncbi:MAG: acid phosphatase [Xanthomonadales bacterium]|nr:acid phosphatase [Xanthomonadales bacterium]
MRRSPLFLALFAAALSLGACRTMPAAEGGTAAADTPVATATVPADDNLNAVLWMQRAAEYRATCETVYHAAADRLDAALKDPDWDALVPAERANAVKGLPPAVVLDVDETVLDNSPYQARLVRGGSEYDEVTWDGWVREEKAQPVPGVLDFARAATARGITLIYISNRAEHLGPATLSNLRKAGLPVKDDSVFLGLGTFVEGCEQEGSEKLCRRQLAGRKYRVLMQFGDQLGDFAQVVANTPDARDALEAQYRGWFGQRWWALPNPSYGSWEPALFNNAWPDPRETRRASKREALNPAE